MKVCQICGKGKKLAIKRKKLRGQFNPVKKYFQKPNLQYLTVNKKRALVCRACSKLILKGKVKL
jgi:hypothetical protein